MKNKAVLKRKCMEISHLGQKAMFTKHTFTLKLIKIKIKINIKIKNKIKLKLIKKYYILSS